jgi:threonine aldolase
MTAIDLRSDTVTHPTQAMRQAMANAEVGDDVYGEDPTVNRLEELSAERMGKEAGLLVASGTMGNLVAVLAHCGRGDEVIMGHLGHTFLYEGGGIAALGGVHPRTVTNQPDGTLLLEDIRMSIRPDELHNPISRLVILENTHNRCGGVVLGVEYTRCVADLAHAHGLSLHLDGARIFNAAAALNVTTAELASAADSITFCLSKALCAPVGSILCGSEPFIARARRIRKQVGGGMRQAGILAAAGMVAFDEIVPTLADDHRRARVIADGIRGMPGLFLDPAVPPTNMIFVTLTDDFGMDPKEFISKMKLQGVLIGRAAERRLRMVTHHWIDDLAVTRVIETFNRVINGQD